MAVTVKVKDSTEEGDFPFVTIDDDGVKEYLRSMGLAYHDTPTYTLKIVPAKEGGAKEVEDVVEEPKPEVLVEPEEKKSEIKKVSDHVAKEFAKIYNEPATSHKKD